MIIQDGIVYEFHLTEKQPIKNRRARSLSVVMLLFVAKQLGKTDLAMRVKKVIPDYKFSTSQYSYQSGDQLNSPRAVAFLLHGAA